MQADRRDLVPPSGIVGGPGWTALILSGIGHFLLLALALAVLHWPIQEPPALVIHEIAFVQVPANPVPPLSASSGPTPAPASTLALAPSPPLPPSPVAPLAAVAAPVVKAKRSVLPPKTVAARPNPAPKPRPLAIEQISDVVAAADSAESAGANAPPLSQGPAVGAAAVSVSSSAPGYHIGSVSTPSPDYPYSARRKRHEGVVLIGLDVGADGYVTQARVLESSGDTALDQAARDTLARWRLRPATQGGHPVAGRVEVPVRFRLQ